MRTIISGKVTKQGDESMEEITVIVESSENDTSVEAAIAYNAAVAKIVEEEE